MKNISKILNIILSVLVLCALIAAIGSAIAKKPILLSVIRSNSMYPVWQKGDIVLIENLSYKKSIVPGDIVFFKAKKGSLKSKGWIAHRIISGNNEVGYTTKGDANKYTDQDSNDTGLIKRGWIGGRAFKIGKVPIVIPKLGYLSLFLEKYLSSPSLLLVIAVIISIFLVIGEFIIGKKRKKNNNKIEIQLIYIIGGLTLSTFIGGAMTASGLTVIQPYEVSEKNQGVLFGSDVGILMVGDQVSRPLSDITNDGIFPLIGLLKTEDEQITLSHNKLFLIKGQRVNASYTVNAITPGKYKSAIKVGFFYPFLPPSVIYFLADKSYWLAVVVVSLVPGMPLFFYPFIDERMRRRTFLFINKKKRKLVRNLPI